jgi:crotonobetaine/carnitine-CoA ligase
VPGKVCFFFDDHPVTFGELERRVTSVANQLLALGVGPGDSVALFTGTCAEWVDTWLAAARIGAVSVPVNTAFRGEFLAHQLRDSKTKLVLADYELGERVAAVAGELPDLAVIVVRDPEGRDLAVSGINSVPVKVLYEGAVDAVSGGRELAWNEPACLLYTSGTTGPSKGVVVSQQYLLTGARTLVDAFGYREDDVLYGALPLFHNSGILGLVLPTILLGSTSVLDAAFHPARFWDRVRSYRATVVAAVGPMIMMLLGLRPDPSDAELPMRILLGAPIPAELHLAIEARYGCKIVTIYGLTEAVPLTLLGADDPAVPGSGGRANPNFDVRIFADDDTELPAGEIGEIVCRPLGPEVMSAGYVNRPDAMAAQFRNLWFHTGDLGRLDEAGNLFFVDRKKDAIRRRGENISSFEVERTILGHPAVAECAAHAVPSPLGEDDVKVCIILKPDASLTPVELMNHCVERMPYFAVPRYVEFVDALPKNAVGRVQKFALRERGVMAGTWDREGAGYLLKR